MYQNSFQDLDGHQWDLDYFKQDFHVKSYTKVSSTGKSEKRENVWSGLGNETMDL